MPTVSQTGALKIANPPAFRKALEKAMAKAKGHLPTAADLLAVNVRTLKRWLAEEEYADIERRPPGPLGGAADLRPHVPVKKKRTRKK